MPQRLNKVVVEAPAKLNLALAVTGVAENGYHTVDMVMQAVDVWERVEVARSAGWSLRCPKSPVPTGESNTATKAAAAFFYHTGLLAGADVTIHKKVPTRAGMAGGSADAAAVLVGLNELYGARLSVDELCGIGRGVGADVPFCVVGGTARATGIGEALAPLLPLPECWLAIAMPCGGGVSTPAAYRRFDEQGSPVRPSIDAACRAIEAGDLAALAPHMQNMLEHANGGESALALRRVMERCGALAAVMTGSGAAVFGLFTQRRQAEQAAEQAKGYPAKTFVARPVAGGARVVQRG